MTPSPLHEFLRTFNAGRYWEAHEVLEAAWRANRSEFYHGLILYASAMVHVERGNAHGVAAQLAKATHALAPYRPRHMGVDVEGIFRDAAARAERWDLPIPPLRLDG